REERTMPMDCIIAQCMLLFPGFLDGKTATARKSWCSNRMLPPHFVFAGEPNNDVFAEVTTYCEPGNATFSYQTKAWFDKRVMREWIGRGERPKRPHPGMPQSAQRCCRTATAC
ncbi:hypothetical protein PHYSODRAFT_506575, partial [Phytophthora sojae]